MNPSILLFGATSILGFNLARLFPDSILPFTSPRHTSPAVQNWAALNLKESKWVETIISKYQPTVLVYTHAICDIPKCEADPKWAYEVNVGHLKRTLEALPQSVRMVYVSSDHVFGGDGTYDEHSSLCPISVYGKTRVIAEQLVLERSHSLVIRTGLAIGSSPNGRTGHLDWLRYRTHRQLPITIIRDEYRSVVWVEDLATRVMSLVNSKEKGIRHIPATRAISRIELANYLLQQLGLDPDFHTESRHQRATPHIGHVELRTRHQDKLSQPLPCVADVPATTLLGEVA